MSGRKRKAPDRLSGELLQWHVAPSTPEQQCTRNKAAKAAESAAVTARHHTLMRQAMHPDDVDYILQLQRFAPDTLDEETAQFAGIGKDIWTLWPHSMDSSITPTASARALEKMRRVLAALDNFPRVLIPTLGSQGTRG